MSMILKMNPENVLLLIITLKWFLVITAYYVSVSEQQYGDLETWFNNLSQPSIVLTQTLNKKLKIRAWGLYLVCIEILDIKKATK